MATTAFMMLMVSILISVAFLILMERKQLSYMQTRKGPNKVGNSGMVQSFADAIKLFIKESNSLKKMNTSVYITAPLISLTMIIFLNSTLTPMMNMFNSSLTGMMMFSCLAFGVYPLMMSGWSSNSSYSLIGAVRGVAQSISYEVSMLLMFLTMIFLAQKFSILEMTENQYLMMMMMIMMPNFFMWMISVLAETNRTPFDFSEGESELVSGFNVEYMSGGFAMLFLSEYASIIFMSYMTMWMFSASSIMTMNIKSSVIVFSIIWIRACLPRCRYDKLMEMAWKTFLPITLMMMTFYMMMMKTM